jgi:hypothetical protein
MTTGVINPWKNIPADYKAAEDKRLADAAELNIIDKWADIPPDVRKKMFEAVGIEWNSRYERMALKDVWYFTRIGAARLCSYYPSIQ